jgi:hypothetical protein
MPFSIKLCISSTLSNRFSKPCFLYLQRFLKNALLMKRKRHSASALVAVRINPSVGQTKCSTAWRTIVFCSDDIECLLNKRQNSSHCEFREKVLLLSLARLIHDDSVMYDNVAALVLFSFCFINMCLVEKIKHRVRFH